MTFNVQRPAMPSFSFTRRVRVLLAVAIVVVVALILFSVYAGIYTDLLWFRSVGDSSVFKRRLITEILLFFVFGVAMAVIVGTNVVVAYRCRPPYRPVSQEQEQLEQVRQQLHRFRGWLLAVVLVLLAIITGSAASKRWKTWLLWRNSTPFHVKDPQFHKDVSYFAFTYPMQRFVLNYAFGIVVVSLLAVLATCYLYGALRLQTPGPRWTPAGRVHVSVLLGVFVLLKAAAYWFDRYGLAFSGRGSVTGPSYTDVNAVLPAKTILVFVAIICAFLFFATAFTRNWTLPAVAFGLMVISAILIGGAFPALVQQFKVKPSQQDLEAKYIARNITETRYAYGIEPSPITQSNGVPSPANITTDANYPGTSTGSASQQRKDASKDAQLRVLDPNVVSSTFEQLQQQRSFYGFDSTLDVDRYPTGPGGSEQDVIIGTREVQLSGLQPSQRNWINEHLVYTHGFGVVAASSSSVNADGSPQFVEQDLPPTGSLGNFQPRIYFGQMSPTYSIVGAPAGTAPRELDQPSDKGTGQINNTYAGNGGVKIGSTWRQLLYAWKFKDKNLLLSSGVNSKSQLLYIRDPRARVKKVAPWLTLDGDPYPVVVDGSVDWVVDGYTTTDGFPYSEQQSLGSATQTSLSGQGAVAAQGNQHINYIRNSVKAIVNAYTGQVTLYAWDQQKTAATPDGSPDPVLETWEKAFPGIIKPQSDIPPDLVEHLRYPEDLFNLQRTLLARYHVSDAHSFYNGTEFWTVPNDPTMSGSTTPQPSYYLTLSPDGGTTPPVFSLTSPFDSLNHHNLTAYLSVDSQPGPNYGHFTLLQLPANQAVGGPEQIQNELDTNTTISPQLTLLGSGGSQVIKGNLLTVPVDGSLLYVEPLYVQASGGQSFPLLRKYLAFSNGTGAYQSTLNLALNAVFGVKGTPTVSTTTPPSGTPTPTPSGSSSPTPTPTSTSTSSPSLQAAIAAAQAAESAAQADLRAGNFAAYGRDEKRLQTALSHIAAAAKASSKSK